MQLVLLPIIAIQNLGSLKSGPTLKWDNTWNASIFYYYLLPSSSTSMNNKSTKIQRKFSK